MKRVPDTMVQRLLPGRSSRRAVREVRLRAKGIFRCVTHGAGDRRVTDEREQLKSDTAKRAYIQGYDVEHLDYFTETGRH